MSDRYREMEGVLVPRHMMAAGYDVVHPSNYYKRQSAFWSGLFSNADEDRLVGSWDLARLRAESWRAYRNRPIAGAISDAICRGVVGTTGIIAQATTDSEDWNNRADEFEARWGTVADYSGLAQSLSDLDWQQCQHMILDGQIFVGLIENGQIVLIEAERVVTPADKTADTTIINGAQRNAIGQITGWYVAGRDTSGAVDATKCEFWSAENLFPVRLMGRVGTTIASPYFSSVLAAMIDLDEYRESIRLKTKYWAKQTAIHTTEQEFDPTKMGGGGANNGGWARRGRTNSASGVAFETVGSLTLLKGAPGDDIKPLDNNLPGEYHIDFIEAAEKEICSRCGVSVEWVKLAFDSSFIASRGAMIATSPSIARFQRAIITQSRARIRNWRIARAIKTGELPPAPRDKRTGLSQWNRCFWHVNSMPILDRTKDSNADNRDYTNRTETLTSLNRKNNGRDFKSEILPEMISELRQMLKLAGYSEWQSMEIPLQYVMPFAIGMAPSQKPAEADGATASTPTEN